MRRILIPALLLAGCAQLPPTPEDIQAKKFGVPPDKSVVYIARALVDSEGAGGLLLDERATITTYQGTYYRWEVEPGPHRVTGFGGGVENVTLNTTPGKIYFLQHTVRTYGSDSAPILSALQEVDDRTGRNLVAQGTLLR